MKLLRSSIPSLLAVAAGLATVLPAWAQTGPGQALKFDGVDDQAGVGTVSGLVAGNAGHTIEAWINPASLPPGGARDWPLTLGNSGTAHHWILNANGTMAIGMWSGPQVGPSVVINRWTHVAAAFDGTTLRVYTNGVLAGTAAGGFNLQGIPLTLAQPRAGGLGAGEQFFHGQLDEVRVWNLARSAADIAGLRNQRLTGTEPGLLLYWRLDEGTGTNIADTGHANNGSLTGGTGWDRSGVPFLPDALTGAATVTSATAATLAGSVHPGNLATSYYFQWGSSTNYGSVTPTGSIPAGSNVVAVTAGLTGLSPDIVYHYRLVASNAVGVAAGADQTFATPGPLGATLITSLVATQGETLTYTLVVTNRTATNIAGLSFNGPADPLIAFIPGSVNTSPLAMPDTYAVLGNVSITIPAPGLLTNDLDYDGAGPALTVIPGTATTTNGGQATLNANGSFTYRPPAGFRGTDRFTYQIDDGEGLRDTGTVTLNVSGMVWFVDSTAPAPGDGRLGSPFRNLSSFATINVPGPTTNGANGDVIFLYTGTHTGPLNLLGQQKLVGAGSSQSLASIIGVVPPGSAPLPPTGGLRPVMNGTGGLGLANGNVVRGLNFNFSGGNGVNGAAVGFLLLTEAAVTNTAGTAVNLAAGTLSVTLDNVTTASASSGIRIANCTGAFAVTGDGTATRNGSGGSIQNSSGNGVHLDTAMNVSLSRMNISGSAGNGIYGQNLTGLVIDWCALTSNGNAPGESGIRLGDPLGANGLTGSPLLGSSPTRIANSLIRMSGEMNVAIFNSSGILSQLEVTNVVCSDTRLVGTGADGFYFETRSTAQATVTFQTCLFSNNFTQGIQGNSLDQSLLTATVTGCQFVNNNEGVVLANTSGADLTFDINANRFTNSLPTGASGAAIAVVNGTTATSGAFYSGRVRNNTILGGGIDNHGIAALLAGFANDTLAVVSNTIVMPNAQFSGVFIQAGETGAGNVNANVTVTDNRVSLGSLGSHGILVQARVASTLCGQILRNVSSTAGLGLFGINVRQRDTSTFRLPGFAGPFNSAPTVAAFVASGNPGSTANATVATAYTGGAACSLPLLVMGAPAMNPSPDIVGLNPAGASPGPNAAYAELPISPADAHSPVELTPDDLAPMVQAARVRWIATGLSESQAAFLGQLRFEVSDLPAHHLGRATGARIELDRRAAGFGWFVDATPMDDAEFTAGFGGAPGRMDLLTVVLHEMGHALGLDDDLTPGDGADLMRGFLPPGRRRLPVAGAAAGHQPHLDATVHHLAAPINIGTLPAGKSITIQFRATVTNAVPPGSCQISSQGTVTAGGLSAVTDDPRTPAALDPTVTALAVPFTFRCPPNVVTNAAPDQCAQFVTFALPASGCPEPSVQFTMGGTPLRFPALLPVGTNVVTCTASTPGVSTSCTFTVVVRDVTQPAITCPANMVVVRNPEVTLGPVPYVVTVSDNCGATFFNCVPPPSTPLPFGVTTVRCAAADASRNSNSCSFTITVQAANTPPVRIAGDLAPRLVSRDSLAGSLELESLRYVPGRVASETNQTLTWQLVTAPPPTLGQFIRPDGSPATVGVAYPMSDLYQLRLAPAPLASGFAWIEFVVSDNGTVGTPPVPDPQSLRQTLAAGVCDRSLNGECINFTSAFNGAPLPPAGTLHGTAYIAPDGGENNSGSLHLTDLVGGQMGSLVVQDQAGGVPVEGFDAAFRLKIGGSPQPADGFSFSWGTNVVNEPVGEEGSGDNLIVAIDTWDNGAPDGGPEAPAVEVRWGATVVARRLLPLTELETGNDWSPARLRLDPAGRLDFSVGTNVYFNGLSVPQYTALSGARFNIGARTGGAVDNHWIDDLSILPRFTPLGITRIVRAQDGSLELFMQGSPNRYYALETSTDLEQWTFYTNVFSPATGIFSFIERNTVQPPARFYRLRIGRSVPGGIGSLWRAEGDGSDSAGNRHGTLVGTAGYGPGQSGKAFDFGPTAGWLSIGAAPLAPPWTAGMWVKRRDSIDGSSALLHDRFGSATGLKLEQWNLTRKVGFTRFGVADYAFNYIAPLDTWTHLTFIGQPGSTSLYVNGVLTDTIAVGFNLPLAQLGAPDGDRLNGMVDEVSVYPRALSVPEVQQLYDATR